MALIPSLFLWSSIKIPFPLCCKQKTSPSVPYVDSCKDFERKNHGGKAEPAREMVSLRVPTPLADGRDKSSPQLFRPPADTREEKTQRKRPTKARTKKISYVTIPRKASLDEHENWRKMAALDSRKPLASSLGEDLKDECAERNSEGVSGLGKCNYVPSIKPWTPEELDEIHQKCNSSEKKKVKTSEDKKKQNKRRGKALTLNKNVEIPRKSSNEFNTFRVPFCEESRNKNPNSNSEDLHNQCDVKHSERDLNLDEECLKSDCWKKRLTVKMKRKPADTDYYENKLAELYLIELGLLSK